MIILQRKSFCVLEYNVITKTLILFKPSSFLNSGKSFVIYPEDDPYFFPIKVSDNRYDLFIRASCFKFKDKFMINCLPDLANYVKDASTSFLASGEDVHEIASFLGLNAKFKA
jgi:hypothetical protein